MIFGADIVMRYFAVNHTYQEHTMRNLSIVGVALLFTASLGCNFLKAMKGSDREDKPPVVGEPADKDVVKRDHRRQPPPEPADEDVVKRDHRRQPPPEPADAR
jgi:hypothetical protein